MIPLNKLLFLQLPYYHQASVYRATVLKCIKKCNRHEPSLEATLQLKLWENKTKHLWWEHQSWHSVQLCVTFGCLTVSCPKGRALRSLFSGCGLHGSFLSLSSMQGTLRGLRRTVPHAMPQGGIRSKQTYGQHLATLIRVSVRDLISWEAGEDGEWWKEWVVTVGM